MAVNAIGGLMVTMTMAIEIPSADQFDEYASDISDVMGGLIHGFTLLAILRTSCIASRIFLSTTVALE